MKEAVQPPKPRSYFCIFLSYLLQIVISMCIFLTYFILTTDNTQAQGSGASIRVHNIFNMIVDIAMILTLTTASSCYGSISRDTKQTFFWVLICEVGIRGLLSFYSFNANEYNVYGLIQEYKESGEKIPAILVMCHLKKKLETYASVIVTGVGILIAKLVLDSKIWEKNQHHHEQGQKCK